MCKFRRTIDHCVASDHSRDPFPGRKKESRNFTYGDIVSDLSAGLVGCLGIVRGANLGERDAIFEAVHGGAPDIAGQGKANPAALMQSAVLMLAHIGQRDVSRRMQNAIERVYAEGKCLTGDVGGSASTTEFTAAVITHMQ